MSNYRRFAIAVVVFGALSLPLAVASSASAAETCKTTKVAVTHLVRVAEKVHGKTKYVLKREDVKVREHVRVKVHGKWKVETRLVVKYRSVSTCTTTPVVPTPTPTPVVTTPAAPVITHPTPTGVAIDPTCTAESNPLIQDCVFSVSETTGSDAVPLSGGVLQFATTEVPNDQGAPLVTPATPGCTLNVTTNTTSSTCTVTYPAAGTYYVETVYEGGPSAYSASEDQAITVTAPPTPSDTTTTLSVGSQDVSTGYPFTATVTDQNGAVASGSVQYSVTVWWTGAVNETVQVYGPVGTACIIVASNPGGQGSPWVISSPNCSGGATLPSMSPVPAQFVLVTASFEGTATDNPSSSAEIKYPS